MGTEKRERQRANRQLKYQQQAKEVSRQRLTKRVVVGVIVAVALLLFILGLAWFANRGDDDAAPTTTTTTVAAQGFAYGTGECPPAEGVDTPVKDFADAPQQCIDPAKSYTATFATDQGDIVVELDAADVPGTVNNFVTLARSGYYDDTTIFRTNTSIDIIQGGGTSNTDSPGYEIPDEGTGYTYAAGDLAMARTAEPDSAGAQWFFVVTDDGTETLDSAGTYVVFGHVTQGLDVAEAILGLAGPDGDTPTTAPVLETVTITER